MGSAAAALAIVGLLLAGWSSVVSGASVEDQAHQLAAELRCPVCQNLSVADSPSEMANQMRDLIRERLRNGETPDQIRAYFVSRYGEWILLAPRREGFNWVAWLLPFAAILGGLAVIGLVAGRAGAKRRGERDDEAAAAIDPHYLQRVEAELREWEG